MYEKLVFYLYVSIFYFLLINTLIKPYDKNDKQHIIDKKHGIVAIIKNKGHISTVIKSSLLSVVQLHNVLLSSIISLTFIYKI